MSFKGFSKHKWRSPSQPPSARGNYNNFPTIIRRSTRVSLLLLLSIKSLWPFCLLLEGLLNVSATWLHALSYHLFDQIKYYTVAHLTQRRDGGNIKRREGIRTVECSTWKLLLRSVLSFLFFSSTSRRKKTRFGSFFLHLVLLFVTQFDDTHSHRLGRSERV